jgi:PhnB protein
MGAELIWYGLIGLLPALLVGMLLGSLLARRSSGRASPRPSVTPYLIVDGGIAAIDWYRDVVGAELVSHNVGAAGRVAHAELRIGASSIFLGDEHPHLEDIFAPPRIGGTPVYLDIETDDVVGLFDRAVAAGATAIRAPTDPQLPLQTAKVRDPFGHVWLITRSGGDQAT